MPRVTTQTYRGKPPADRPEPLGQADAPTLTRNLSYEAILADMGVERDDEGRLFHWVPMAPRGHRRHWVTLTSREAQDASLQTSGQCFDWYAVGLKCRNPVTPCDEPVVGWIHWRGGQGKFSNEHPHLLARPNDELWPEDEAGADVEAGAEPALAGV